MPDAGYSTDNDAMSWAQNSLDQLAADPAGVSKDVAPTKMTAEEFGRVHGHHFDRYSVGIDEIGAGLSGLSAALSSLGGGIGSANTMYQDQESAAAGQVGAAQGTGGQRAPTAEAPVGAQMNTAEKGAANTGATPPADDARAGGA